MRGLPLNVKGCLEKARDSAVMAVEMYNKPAVKFKSGGYIVMMNIAWTALFHAHFFLKGIKPAYRKGPRRYDKIEGDYKYWELSECLKQYFKADTENPVRKNLEFFIKLRNKIEHRSMPQLDPDLFGECQAMLLNFNDYLESLFGKKYAIRESLTFALQMYPEPRGIQASSASQVEDAAEFIQSYRSSLTATVANSGQYAFRAFLIQVGNHSGKNALPIQFFQYNSLTDEQKEELGKFAVLTKEKIVPMANVDRYKPKAVVELVREQLIKLGHKNPTSIFSMNIHTDFWKKHKVRPPQSSAKPEKTDSRFCIYDHAHRDYVYLQEWVDLIVKELTENAESKQT